MRVIYYLVGAGLSIIFPLALIWLTRWLFHASDGGIIAGLVMLYTVNGARDFAAICDRLDNEERDRFNAHNS